MKLGPLVLVAFATGARAEGWKLQLEAGSGYDSNVQRQSGSAGDGAPEARAGGRFSFTAAPAEKLRVAGAALALGRAYPTGDARRESGIVVSGDARADILLGDVAPGARASYYDSLAFDTARGALDFRTGEAAAMVALRSGEHRLSAFAGWRFFELETGPAFDFAGERFGVLWALAPESEGESFTVSAAYSVARRRYDAKALANLCAPGAPILPSCLLPTAEDRVDLFHDAAIQATYTGVVLVTGRYQLMVNDSSSFAQSLVRHRFELGATMETWLDVVLTVKLLLQLNQYPDGLLLGGDLGTFTTVEDETRNTLVVHLTREVGEGLMLEARYAFYTSPFAQDAIAYDRHTLYLGVVWTIDGK